MATAASDYDEPWKEVCDTRFQRVLELSCPDLVADIDWTRPIQFLNTELQTLAPAAKVGRQHVDHLAKVLWKPSGSRVLIHTEGVPPRARPIGTAYLLATPPGGPEPPAQSRAPNLSCLGCPS